jgi:hypothetical protein
MWRASTIVIPVTASGITPRRDVDPWAVNRFQVKTPKQDWTTKGPDLLRTKTSALAVTEDIIATLGPFEMRQTKAEGWTNWKDVGKRASAIEAMDTWCRGLKRDQDRMQLRGKDGLILVGVLGSVIQVVAYPSATNKANEVWALYHRAWPTCAFGGIYNCKRFGGSTDPKVGYSAHAWGDAVDVSHGPTASVFDWGRRMAAAGQLKVVQVIGTVDGKIERQAKASAWKVEPYSGNGSHLWHVHNTCLNHTGIPPCAK